MVSTAFVSTACVLILLSVGSYAAPMRRLKQEEDSPSPPTASSSATATVETTPVELPTPSISISVEATTTEPEETPPTDPEESPDVPDVDTTPSPESLEGLEESPDVPDVDTTPSPESLEDLEESPDVPDVDTTPPTESPEDPAESPPDSAVPSSSCRPALCEAAELRDESVIRDAIQDGELGLCDCVCDDTTGDTLLHVSACSEAVAYAILLLEPPPECDVDVMDADGGSPLHEAAGCCNGPMTFNFLNFGADTEKLNDAGLTPLCVVALQDLESCGQLVNQLVEFGADICAPCPTPDGPMLPVDVAVNTVVRDVIIRNGGNPVDLGGTC